MLALAGAEGQAAQPLAGAGPGLTGVPCHFDSQWIQSSSGRLCSHSITIALSRSRCYRYEFCAPAIACGFSSVASRNIICISCVFAQQVRRGACWRPWGRRRLRSQGRQWRRRRRLLGRALAPSFPNFAHKGCSVSCGFGIIDFGIRASMF